MTHENRRRLPAERDSVTHKFEIRTQKERYKGYLIVGFYTDGTVGEIFVRMDQMGSEISGFIDAWAVAVSMLLQTGTSLAAICDKYRGAQFDPSGMTGDPRIPFARSPVDYIARYLENRFLKEQNDGTPGTKTDEATP